MERVIIIGCGGSGKSTLARELGERTGLPVVHLDQIYWEPGNWQHLTGEAFDARLEAELEKPRWILDGNFNRTISHRLEFCDTAVFLDFNRFVCLTSWIKRVISNWGTAREDMAPGCKEWFDPEMAGWIWNYNKTKRPGVLAALSKAENVNVVILKNRRQVRRFLKENT